MNRILFLANRMIFIFSLSFLFACNENVVEEPILSNLNQTSDLNQYERLSFSSSNELFQAIVSIENGGNYKKDPKFSRFVSLMDEIPEKEVTLRAQKELECQNFYTALEYDVLIPNESLARLVNPVGEIEVDNYVYKITPEGTYRFSKDKEFLFDELYVHGSLTNGELVEENMYRISDGIFLYDTFRENDSFYELVYEGDISLVDDNVLMMSSSGATEPNFSSFPTYSPDRKTWAGKLIQNLIGTTKTHTIDFSSSRRLRGQFYSYNYFFYSEIGVSGWTDKKNWIGWSKTPSDELRVGWKNVVLESKIPDYWANSLKTANQPIVFSPVYTELPGTKYKVNVSTLVIPNYDPSEFEKYLSKGTKEAFGYLKKLLGSQSSSSWEKSEALAIATRTHIYSIILNEDKRFYNTESYTHVFANQVKFMITLNPMDLPQLAIADAAKWFNAIKETSSMVYPTLKSGEVYVCGRFGSNWKGMKIKK